MNRNEVLGAGLAEHRPDLLWVGVIPNPWIVGGDRKRRDVGREVVHRCEYVGHGAVARDQHAMPVLLQYVTVEAVVMAPRPSLAPMIRAHRCDRETAHLRAFAPSWFPHIRRSGRA